MDHGTSGASRDHLRVCGADSSVIGVAASASGSSPRVRSRRHLAFANPEVFGIISACAEQTLTYSAPYSNAEDHLRVCGADADRQPPGEQGLGSSPRVRSRPLLAHVRPPPVGIISACAEQTRSIESRSLGARDHLRVCGADANRLSGRHRAPGSSPRVRSRHFQRARPRRIAGIISACAEQTWGLRKRRRVTWDHLRVCGADAVLVAVVASVAGSSPRVRSRQTPLCDADTLIGIISACAEQTRGRRRRRKSTGDHLRVCGADQRLLVVCVSPLGSSPRVRSRPRTVGKAFTSRGIISACAEQTPTSNSS